MKVSVKMPGGLVRVADAVTPVHGTTCLLKFGAMQSLYAFGLKDGKGRAPLNGWVIDAGDLKRIREGESDE